MHFALPIECGVEAGGEILLGQRDRQRCGGGEQTGAVQGRRQRLAFRDDVVDQTDLLGPLGAHLLAIQKDLARPALSDPGRKRVQEAKIGHQTDAAETCGELGVGGGHNGVAAKRQRQSGAHRVALDGGHDRQARFDEQANQAVGRAEALAAGE